MCQKQQSTMYLQCIPVSKNKYHVSLCCTDSLKKKLSALPSPEREITTVNLKKDVKYGLGKSVYMHFPEITAQFHTASAATSQLSELTGIINCI